MKNHSLRTPAFWTLRVAITALSLVWANLALADDDYRSSSFTLQALGYGRESMLSGEFNLGGKASVTFEGTYIRKGEDLGDREIEETNGDSLVSMGREFAVLFSRYTNPQSMSGFHWTLGTGYRTMSVAWNRHPKEYENTMFLRMSPEGRAEQEFTLQGVTGHGRLGYRFMSDSFPVTLGIYLGIRHYQATVRDSFENSGETTENRTHEDVRSGLQHRYMTSMEPGLTFGMVL